MSDNFPIPSIEISNTSSLYQILKVCADQQSYDSLFEDDYNDAWNNNVCDYYKMIATSSHSTSGNISTTSYASDESYNDNILEENGRISLAYENLRTIPRKIAEKFSSKTKFLDLSYNNFQNLSFLSFFEELHTLILDRNTYLDGNTLPFLPNLRILWINNCEIKNITDWIQRIQKQCPVLEHLSIMGNPGLKNVFSFCTLPSYAQNQLQDENPENPVATMGVSCREYILQALPNLEYLDGLPRYSRVENPNAHATSNGNGAIPHSASTTNHSGFNGSSGSEQRTNKKTSPTLSFKNLFRLKRRKKSYQSSSTTN